MVAIPTLKGAAGDTHHPLVRELTSLHRSTGCTAASTSMQHSSTSTSPRRPRGRGSPTTDSARRPDRAAPPPDTPPRPAATSVHQPTPVQHFSDRRPRVSRTLACVVAYNRSAMLSEVLDALLQQLSPEDVLVIDNASTDDTAAVVREFPLGIRYFNPGANIGGAGGFAWAIELASRSITTSPICSTTTPSPNSNAIAVLEHSRRPSSSIAPGSASWCRSRSRRTPAAARRHPGACEVVGHAQGRERARRHRRRLRLVPRHAHRRSTSRRGRRRCRTGSSSSGATTSSTRRASRSTAGAPACCPARSVTSPPEMEAADRAKVARLEVLLPRPQPAVARPLGAAGAGPRAPGGVRAHRDLGDQERSWSRAASVRRCCVPPSSPGPRGSSRGGRVPTRSARCSPGRPRRPAGCGRRSLSRPCHDSEGPSAFRIRRRRAAAPAGVLECLA